MRIFKRLPQWAATTVVAMFVITIGATAANALSCDDCVDGSDIVNGSVQRADLAMNARSLIGRGMLIQDSGIGSTTDTFDEFTVNVPASGVLEVRVEGMLWLDFDSGSGNSVIGNATIGLCTAPDSLSSNDCGQAYYNLWSQDADDAESSNETDPFTITRVLNVPAGPRTFYLNGFAQDGVINIFGGPGYDGAQVFATYHHGTLTLTTDSPAP